MTKADHREVGSTPGMFAPGVAEDITLGDSMNDEELAKFYQGEVEGMRSILDLPATVQESLRRSHIETWAGDLEYYKSRGIDIAEGETLLPKTNPELQKGPKK